MLCDCDIVVRAKVKSLVRHEHDGILAMLPSKDYLIVSLLDRLVESLRKLVARWEQQQQQHQ